ncbi:MAG: DUF1295 domain-containing protein [Pseudomonadales bacterium]|nr:DUF1295 domain-containing protein [Pseudomonadales bacterium]
MEIRWHPALARYSTGHLALNWCGEDRPIDTIYLAVLVSVFVAAAIVLVLLLWIDAPYGKHGRSGWGPSINPRLFWFLMELPAFAAFGISYLLGPHALSLWPLFFCVLFEGHYFHRAFIYPLTLRPRQDGREPMVLILMAMTFNLANGYLNGTYLSSYAVHLYSTDWFRDPRFSAGLILFVFGVALNKHSDHVLRHLRGPGESGYRIPQGGGFRFVSCPNYLGELIQWSGFALAAWSPAGLAFAIFTAANLVPRALASHRWYIARFPDYPAARKAILPGLL